MAARSSRRASSSSRLISSSSFLDSCRVRSISACDAMISLSASTCEPSEDLYNASLRTKSFKSCSSVFACSSNCNLAGRIARCLSTMCRVRCSATLNCSATCWISCSIFRAVSWLRSDGRVLQVDRAPLSSVFIPAFMRLKELTYKDKTLRRDSTFSFMQL